MLLKIVMVLMYLALAWFVERKSTNPEGKIRAFFHIVCAPVAVPVSRRMRPGTSYERVLVVSMVLVAAVWALLIVANELLVR